VSDPAFLARTEVFGDDSWRMTLGERFALEGVLCQLAPDLAVEVGVHQGGSLRRVAAHSREVHAFDIAPETADVIAAVPNAVAHVGDSAELLPALLRRFTDEGRFLDFALIDGDHSFEGVQRDTLALLDSPSCVHTTIVLHDTANDVVREALEALDLPGHPKVGWCQLDFVPGYVVAPGGPQEGEAWNGLGLVVLADSGGRRAVGMEPPRLSVSDVYRGISPARTT
jgi:hypothetical protein